LIESYSEARNKLKKAETSDINTDTDDRAQRKFRAKKQINTTDNDESDSSSNYQSYLPPYPKAPMVYSSK